MDADEVAHTLEAAERRVITNVPRDLRGPRVRRTAQWMSRLFGILSDTLPQGHSIADALLAMHAPLPSHGVRLDSTELRFHLAHGVFDDCCIHQQLRQCAKDGNVECMRILLRALRSIGEVFTMAHSPMATAAVAGHCGIVRLLTDSAPVKYWHHEVERDPDSALMQAVAVDQVDCVRLLLDSATKAGVLEVRTLEHALAHAAGNLSYTTALAILDYLEDEPRPRAMLKHAERCLLTSHKIDPMSTPFLYPAEKRAPALLFADITDSMST